MKNLTPHAIVIRTKEYGDKIYSPSGEVARVTTSVEVVTVNPEGTDIIRTVYGEVEGLGSPLDYPNGVLVSGLVLSRLSSEWSGIAFAPATGPSQGAIRNPEGQIIAVTSLVTV